MWKRTKWVLRKPNICITFAALFQLLPLYLRLHSCISPLKVLIMVPYLTIFWTKSQISHLLYCSRLWMENHLNGTWPKSMLLVGFRLASQTSCYPYILYSVWPEATLSFPKNLLSLCSKCFFFSRWTNKNWCMEVWPRGMMLIVLASSVNNMHSQCSFY